MTLQVIRTYSTGDHRFRYNLRHNGKEVSRIITDTEARYALVTLEPRPQMQLRRGVADISHAEIEDASIHIVTINQ